MELYHYLIAIVGGGIAGVINTLAGNGSAITLTILTEILGLPPNVANGTNRMVAMFLVILVKPKRWLRETDLTVKRNYWLIIPGFLAIGFYGGFIQMGMGIFFLAIMVLGARHSMTDANAVKSFVIAIYTIVVIAIFQWKGLIDWKMGALMALGQTTGGWWGATFASRYESANLWAYRLLVVIVVLAIVKLFNFNPRF